MCYIEHMELVEHMVCRHMVGFRVHGHIIDIEQKNCADFTTRRARFPCKICSLCSFTINSPLA